MIVYTYQTFRQLFATSSTLASDGFEVWPVAKLRSGGFSGGFVVVPSTPTVLNFVISVDNVALGVMAHDLYLSQRTDDQASQLLHVADLGSHSGSWTVTLSSAGVAALGVDDTDAALTDAQMLRALKYCHVYVRRHSDGAIQWVDLAKLVGVA